MRGCQFLRGPLRGSPVIRDLSLMRAVNTLGLATSVAAAAPAMGDAGETIFHNEGLPDHGWAISGVHLCTVCRAG